jgi:taurine transport system permease protein
MTLDESGEKARKAYIKAIDRIFKRLDDGVIFPSDSMQGMHNAVANLYAAVDDAKGGLSIIESLFFPGQGIVKSRTLCTEQGPGRWLPKPTDVIATFGQLANPNLETGGGYKARHYFGGNGFQSLMLSTS